MTVTINGTTGLATDSTSAVVEAVSLNHPSSSTAAITMDASNNVTLASNLTMTGGIYLGGTGSDNFLDDAETGTWTPTWGGNSGDGSITYSSQVGTYTKIGRIVVARGYIGTTAFPTAPSGTLRIRGLPYVNLSGTEYVGSVGYGSCFNSGTFPDTIHIENGGTGFYLYYSATKGDNVIYTNSATNLTTGHFYFSVTYQTS